jgi:hypothetical protein
VRRFATVDFTQYLKAIGLLLRNPVIVLAPLAASGGAINYVSGGIWTLIFFLINSFGLGIALIAADGAWRSGKASFENALDEGKRKAGDILMAAIGLNFVLFAASLAGNFIGPVFGLLLSAVALYFFMYALPAAAIGSVPGGASLSVSIDRVKSNYLAAALLFIAMMAVYIGVYTYALPYALEHAGNYGTVVERIVQALVLSIASSYIALVLAKTYSDVSFTVPRW